MAIAVVFVHDIPTPTRNAPVIEVTEQTAQSRALSLEQAAPAAPLPVAISASRVAPEPEPAPVEEAPKPAWTFAVLSDLHLPNTGKVPDALRAIVDALIVRKPRFVVVTGDFTNGGMNDTKWRLKHRLGRWWGAAREGLDPLIAAGIPVFPVAGNHDSYMLAHRRAYADAWHDLAQIARPYQIDSLAVHASTDDPRVDAAPLSYSVDVDGVHLAFAHIVDRTLDPSVRAWLEDDLKRARDATHRIVFGHVPGPSIVTGGSKLFARQIGRLLADHDVFAYVAGHEHLVWDEEFKLPDGRSFRQIIVGTASATYRYGPQHRAQKRAQCRRRGKRWRCEMPSGGFAFALKRRQERELQVHEHSLTMFEVDGENIRVTPLALKGTELVEYGEPITR